MVPPQPQPQLFRHTAKAGSRAKKYMLYSELSLHMICYFTEKFNTRENAIRAIFMFFNAIQQDSF